jgi:precorrin-2 dehydrogenase/sirohydrochlorin ferrochelatase
VAPAAVPRLAITATDDPAVNRQVARDGDAANVLVNSADDPANCSFILPAVVRRGDLQLTVSTNGRSPAFASWARRRLEQTFTDTHARLLELLSDVRDEVRDERGSTELADWDGAIDDELIDLIDAGEIDRARARVRAALGLEGSAT